jgi:hypothetical protein
MIGAVDVQHHSHATAPGAWLASCTASRIAR